MENESMRDERQELAGSQADVPEKELNRRNLESAPEQEQPTFDVDEADLVVPQPEEPAPDPAEFTDADVKAVREETVVEGKPVEVENWRPETAYPEEPTAAERMANNAREQATAAADAFRRGELMRDASVDPAADSDDRLIALLSYATQ